MDSLFLPIKDIVRHYIIGKVNTDDRNLNASIVTFVTAVLAITTWTTIMEKIYGDKDGKGQWRIMTWFNCKGKKKKFTQTTDLVLNDETCAQIMNSTDNVEDHNCTSWEIEKVPIFHQKLMHFLARSPCLSSQLDYDFSKDTVVFKNQSLPQMVEDITYCSSKFDKKMFLPIYVCTDGTLVFIEVFKNSLRLRYRKVHNLTEFSQYIKNLNVNVEAGSKAERQLKITFHAATSRASQSIIYPNRNFDRFVSRYRIPIENLLSDFINSNATGLSTFNGFGTYNLGFMLYGPPGTGKTSVIKAVCNYTKRDALVVNMSKIKTSKAFEELFDGDLSTKVFVFEEFDLIQGVIMNRSDDKGEKTADYKAELKQKRVELTSMKLLKDANLAEIDKQIADIDAELVTIDSALTLETMLTVLDGVKEHRNRLIVATTNMIERVDPALLREGRFDMKIELGCFNRDEVEELVLRMYAGNLTPSQILRVKNSQFKEGVFKPVQIINICQMYRDLDKILSVLSSGSA